MVLQTQISNGVGNTIERGSLFSGFPVRRLPAMPYLVAGLPAMRYHVAGLPAVLYHVSGLPAVLYHVAGLPAMPHLVAGRSFLWSEQTHGMNCHLHRLR